MTGTCCRSWKIIVKAWMMEVRGKHQGIVVLVGSVFSVVKMVNCVSQVKGAVVLEKNPFNGEMPAKMVK